MQNYSFPPVIGIQHTADFHMGYSVQWHLPDGQVDHISKWIYPPEDVPHECRVAAIAYAMAEVLDKYKPTHAVISTYRHSNYLHHEAIGALIFVMHRKRVKFTRHKLPAHLLMDYGVATKKRKHAELTPSARVVAHIREIHGHILCPEQHPLEAFILGYVCYSNTFTKKVKNSKNDLLT